MKKKILITGANGFVGYHLLKAAVDAGFDVYAGVRKDSNISHLKDIAVNFAYLNYAEVDSLKNDFNTKKYNFIIHAAGATKARNSETYNTINAQYTKNVATAAESINPEKFVFISSLAALGPTKYGSENILFHDTVPNPITSYGKSKLLAEQYLKRFSELRWIIIRPTAVYGPREKDILLLINAINKGVEVYLGNSRQSLSFVHVEDLAGVAIQACLCNRVQECYNISDGNRYDTREFSGIIKKELKRKTIKITIPNAVLQFLASAAERLSKGNSILNKEKVAELTAENWYCSIEKVQQELSFTPEYQLKNGMKNTIDWYKTNKWI